MRGAKHTQPLTSTYRGAGTFLDNNFKFLLYIKSLFTHISEYINVKYEYRHFIGILGVLTITLLLW